MKILFILLLMFCASVVSAQPRQQLNSLNTSPLADYAAVDVSQAFKFSEGFALESTAAVAPHVRGKVFRRVDGVNQGVAGARIDIWIQKGSYGRYAGTITTDVVGDYDITATDGFYHLYTTKSGYLQPCANGVTVGSSDVTKDIELMAPSDLDAGNLPQSAPGYTISGTARVNGKPTAGVDVLFEWGVDRPSAWTRSGPDGTYLVCGVFNGYWGAYAMYNSNVLTEDGFNVTGDIVLDVGEPALPYQCTADGPADTLTEFCGTYLTFPVNVNGQLLEATLNLFANTPALVFRIDKRSLASIVDTGQARANYDPASKVLTIPSVRFGTDVVENVQLLLTNEATLEFTLTNFEVR